MTSIGIDETSRKLGHKYVTLAVDMEDRKVFHVTEDKGKDTWCGREMVDSLAGGNPVGLRLKLSYP